jgi:hypothetical protein
MLVAQEIRAAQLELEARSVGRHGKGRSGVVGAERSR